MASKRTLPSGAVLFPTDGAPAEIQDRIDQIWIKAWRREYRREREELTDYQQPVLGGEA